MEQKSSEGKSVTTKIVAYNFVVLQFFRVNAILIIPDAAIFLHDSDQLRTISTQIPAAV